MFSKVRANFSDTRKIVYFQGVVKIRTAGWWNFLARILQENGNFR